ncbi:P-loop containing nucleoside triphosphate hydrolase protein [Cylindrobasidium torrendii FP15055 ss-10]|uniref:p-loop containing nucleoside triphosphate hydrolase protein n=1 Tax=Cylindrobasidium torrendii FP15055 ss-10 TaxID=1314674 RepID=A0A0D7BL08_9AGAR|nr:P-loop containing nucleoside triphosphate hydrolase protein [Cylindrobasidium torrendii FP15055 ss-10]
MAKRRQTRDSESESSGDESPQPKRVRTSNGDDNEDARPARQNGKTASRKKRADDDGDVDMDDDLEEEDEEFESKYGKEFMDKLKQKKKLVGGVSEMGIIESIEMHQFMCHKFLSFTFGPQINFIIGHNGSGKSAVLSAITIALGGKAASTGRANGLKSFIREGQSVAQVTISLKNQGPDAFKPKEYGKSIVITRRFTKEGNASWKIQSKDGKAISTKKEELAAICDHMNLQVDNPMNVLTQDQARQFLSAASPQDMYKFFLRGTQLSQLREEYQTCMDNCHHTATILLQKKEALPDLKRKHREAWERFREAEKARAQKGRLEDLKKELSWAHVKVKEDELLAAESEVAKQERRIPKVEDSLTQAKSAFDEYTAAVEAADADLQNMAPVADLNQQKEEWREKGRKLRTQEAELKTERKQMEESYRMTKEAIKLTNDSIEKETRKLNSNTQGKRDEHQRLLNEAEAKYNDAKERLPDILEKLRIANEEVATMNVTGGNLTNELNKVRQDLMNAEGGIREANNAERNQYAAYGIRINEVVQQVQRAQWAGEVPIGPLGLYVECKDVETWGNLLRSQLGNMLTAWAVTTARDAATLRQMLGQYGNKNMLVIITERDMFDYRAGEPPEGVRTILRTLDISDEYVKRILINQLGIERVVLAESRSQGEEVLRNLGKAGNAWTRDGFGLRRFAEGGESTAPLNMRTREGTNMLFTGRSADAQREYFTRIIKEKQAEIHRLNQEINQLMMELNKKRADVDRLKAQEKAAHTAMSSAKAKQQALHDAAQEAMPANIGALESSKRDSEQEKESIELQFAELSKREADIEAEVNVIKAELEKIRVLTADYDAKRRKLQAAAGKAAEDRAQAQHNLRYMEGKLVEEQRKLDDLKAAAALTQTEFEQWTAAATEFCEKIENPRPPAVIEREQESTKRALRERERMDGRSVEKLTEEFHKAKEVYETVKATYEKTVQLNSALQAALHDRLQRWHEFRRHIALRCKFAFMYNLSHRGYFGRVMFDHTAKKLDLKVRTEDVAMTQQGGASSRDKDPKSLSGGEKSFATISLLLALWEAIGCPLRCLDEFDVFMDAVNRRISMRMMIETAKSSDKQYVLITPQDMNNITIDHTVRVHRMTDPERNQGTLAFNS